MLSGRVTRPALTERRLGKRRIEIAGKFLKAKRTLPASCAVRVEAVIICFHAGRRWSESGKQCGQILTRHALVSVKTDFWLPLITTMCQPADSTFVRTTA